MKFYIKFIGILWTWQSQLPHFCELNSYINCNYHHHWPPPHSASCPSASAVFVSVAGWKSSTSASCRGWFHHVCKCIICASGWMKKHHHRKLQLLTTTTSASGIVAPVERRETPQVQGAKARMQGAKVRTQGAKIRASIMASRYRMQQQHAATATTTTTTDQI